MRRFLWNKVAVPLTDGEFIVDLPKKNNFDYAQLRVGLTRNVGSNYHPIIKLNGKELDVPLEDCAQRLTDKEYATTKIFLVNTADLTSRNRISVTFADNSEGAIGSVVLRAGLKKKENMRNSYFIYLALTTLSLSQYAIATQFNDDPPNIVVIMADDVGLGDISYHVRNFMEKNRFLRLHTLIG